MEVFKLYLHLHFFHLEHYLVNHRNIGVNVKNLQVQCRAPTHWAAAVSEFWILYHRFNSPTHWQP